MIGMEGFSCLIVGMWLVISLLVIGLGEGGKRGLVVSLSFFWDDTLLFCEPNHDQLAYLS